MYHQLRNLSKKLWAVTLLLLSICVLTGWSFSIEAAPAPDTATGVVVDQEGEPMVGASVLVVGTTKGSSTNIDGEFSIPNVNQGATIRITFVGCKPANVKWEGQPLRITLEDDVETLDEVVVVGFGSQKKVNLTGAVNSVSAKEISNRPVSSVSDAIQGLVPGLNVLSSSLGGQLNGTRSINIRGTGTIGTGASVTPLILIDGMEGALETVNPQDIENISILKDASASSIYGTRAAGGVILVTTKNGKEGKVTVNYSNSFRFSHVMRMPEKMDAYNYAIMMNEGSVNAGGGLWLPEEKVQQIKDYMDNPVGPSMFANPSNQWEVWDLVNLIPIANVDWLQEHFGKTAFSHEHNLSVNGGSERVNYYFSASLLDQDGILRYGNDGNKRYSINGRANVKITDWLTFGYSTRWWRNDYDSPSLLGDNSSNQFYHDVMRYWNLIPIQDPNGHYVRESYIPALLDGGRFKKNQDQFDQQFLFHATPLKGLNIHGEFNYRTYSQNIHRYYFDTYSYNVDDQPYVNPASAMPTNTSVYDYNYKQNYFNPNVYADYSFTINDSHSFKVMAGFQAEWQNYKAFSAQRTNILNEIPWLNTTNGTPQVSGLTETWSTAGWFGRINYDYKGRYLVEANLRYDGTSRFRSGRRWSTSPSFSVGWNIAQESFMEDITHIINTLKLRGSWGRLGNQNTTSLYPTYTQMGYNANSYGWLINGQKPTYATQPGLVASSLTWETNQTWDIGLDWGLVNNRLTGSFDYYQRKTYDMVGPGPDLPDVLGASVPNVNSISMTSKGWEISINWRDRIRDFYYGVGFNLSDYQITIDEYDNNPSGSLGIGSAQHGPYYKGAKLGNIWGYKVIGIAKTDEEMNEHLATADQSALGSSWRAGDIMYADLDGDGVVGTGKNTAESSGDRVVIGNNTPRYSFGLTLDAQWKGFDVKVFFQGVLKRDYWADGAVFTGPCANNQWQAAGLVQHLDYFRPEGTDNPLGPNVDAYYPRPNWSGGKNFAQSDRYIQNAAYGRLKNVTVGYTLPQNLTRKAYIENLRIFFSGENLATITSFTGTGDPELVDSYYSAYGYGKVYPLSRVFSFGLNVTF